ncbi:hypothetical protein DPV78_006565 [Talaromyces pinophilus]|nr:hypothetical protein DPV78_006565 [Talaromyces pinophilus]
MPSHFHVQNDLLMHVQLLLLTCQQTRLISIARLRRLVLIHCLPSSCGTGFLAEFKADIAVFDIMGAQNLEDLGALVVERTDLRKTG